jgi:hypothetical protein
VNSGRSDESGVGVTPRLSGHAGEHTISHHYLFYDRGTPVLSHLLAILYLGGSAINTNICLYACETWSQHQTWKATD